MDIIDSILQRYPAKWIKRVSIITIGQVLAQGLGFAFLVILAWFYTKDEYGYIRYLLGIGSFAGTVVSAGIPAALARYFARNKENKDLLNDYFSNGMAVMLFLMGCTSLILYLIYRDLILILIMLGVSITGVYQGMVRGLLLYGRIASFYLSVNLLKIILLLLFVYIIGFSGVIIPLVIFGSASLFVIVLYSLIFPLGLRFRPETIRITRIKEMSAFSAWVMTTTLAQSALSTFTLIIIEYYSGYADVASYSVAYTMITPFTLATLGVNIVLYPKIAETDNPIRHSRMMKLAMLYSAGISLLLILCYSIFGEWMILLLFSERYLSSYTPMMILSLGALFINIRTSFSAYFEGIGRPHISTADGITSAIVCLAVAFSLVPRYGIIGAACGVTLGFLSACIVDIIAWVKRPRKVR